MEVFLSISKFIYSVNLACIILNYLVYRLKNKEFNLILSYSLSFLVFEILFMNLNIQKYIVPKSIVDFLYDKDYVDAMLFGFYLTLLIDLILTTIYFKKEKDKFIIGCIITLAFIILLITVFFMSIYYVNNNMSLSGCYDASKHYICMVADIAFVLSNICIFFKLAVQLILIIFFVYKLLEKVFIYLKEKIYNKQAKNKNTIHNIYFY